MNEIKEILALPRRVMTNEKNLPKLVKHYKDEFGRDVCTSCLGSMHSMLMTLKNRYKMSSFELKGNAYYRFDKSTSRTINNRIMTDELALAFLKQKPERIRLFAKYPEDWEDQIALLDDEDETQEEVYVDTAEEQQKRAELYDYKLSELRENYEDIKFKVGMSKEDFITKILEKERK